MNAPAGECLLRRDPRPDAATRMYCFPHSGGSPGEFLAWSGGLPAVELWAVQTPGHGGRVLEPAPSTMRELIAVIAREVVPEPPYDLFGHSLGAVVAYELALTLRDEGRPLPRRLYVSAHPAPSRHRPPPPPPDDDEALLADVESSFGPVPAELRDDPDWRALALGPLRADLHVVAGYRPRATAPLPCAVVAMGGTDDPTTTRADLAAWRDHTTGPFALRQFAGDHFYHREHQDDVLRYLATDLARPAH